MNKTNIAWTDYTWNPVTGCSPISEGCQNCYAAAINKRFHLPQKIQFHPDRLEEPLKNKKPGMIFPGSMTDLFHKDVPFKFIDQIMAVIAICQQHTFQVLTKRADRMLEYFGEAEERIECNLLDGGYPNYYEWPIPNIWLGVTAENQHRADERIPKLLQIPAAVRFVSLEPLLEEIDMTGFKPWYGTFAEKQVDRGLNWVIVGAETGPGRRECKIEWVRSIVEQCRAAGVPCFVKQIEINGKISHDPNEWPVDLRVRQWPEKKPSIHKEKNA